MQTILGANGQIANELIRELKRTYTSDLRLVSRNPKKVHDSDSLFPADLMDAEKTAAAVQGSEIAYLTVGMPMDTALWQKCFPPIMKNVIDGCKKHNVKLVFFDNTYMYPQNNQILTEVTVFAPHGPKGEVRSEITRMLLKEIESNQIEALICRAPEFYGPGKTQSITNSFIFDKIEKGEKLKVLISDETLRTLIWTPDASKAMALLGNTADAYNQTWHLPCDDKRLSYRELIGMAAEVYKREFPYSVITRQEMETSAVSNKGAMELLELLTRYGHDNLFDSSKFKKRFPEFAVTPYIEGIEQIKTQSGLDDFNRGTALF